MTQHFTAEGLPVGDMPQPPIVIETPAVKRAYKHFLIAALLAHKPVTTMAAHIVESSYTFTCPGDNN